MVKRIIILFTVIFLIGISTVYWLRESTNAKLMETITIQKQLGDYTLHIRVEDTSEGFQVLRSLQYHGDETIVISHRTPLIGISINQSFQNFTGSPITKTLDPDDFYHPHDPQVFTSFGKGRHTLFVHCQFMVNGETINIEAVEDLILN